MFCDKSDKRQEIIEFYFGTDRRVHLVQYFYFIVMGHDVQRY